MHLHTHLGTVLCNTAVAFYINGIPTVDSILKALEIKRCYLSKLQLCKGDIVDLAKQCLHCSYKLL